MARILVIEDDEQIRGLLRKILEREEHDVLEASDGNKGLQLYQEKRPDLVITDIIMPEKEGLETIRELKKMNPDIRIIAISGGGKISSDMYLELAQNLGAFFTVKKPFERIDILNAVNRYLKDGES